MKLVISEFATSRTESAAFGYNQEDQEIILHLLVSAACLQNLCYGEVAGNNSEICSDRQHFLKRFPPQRQSHLNVVHSVFSNEAVATEAQRSS